MSALLPGVLSAAAASLALNASYVVQHTALASAPAIRPTRPIATARALLGSPRWLSGAALGYVGLGLNIVALGLAPLALVETIIAAGLVVVALAASRLHGDRPSRRQLAAVGLMTAAVAALSIGPAAAAGGPTAASTLAFGAGAGLTALAIVTPRGRPASRAARLGLAAGVLYGATTLALAVFMSGPVGSAGAAAAAIVAVTAAGGFFAFQRGLQSGAAVTVVTLMTAATNLVAVAGAVLVLGQGLGATPALIALHGVGFALVPVAAGLAAVGLVPARAAVRC
jgi:drug/metabolite transporter (DMT)-like permease